MDSILIRTIPRRRAGRFVAVHVIIELVVEEAVAARGENRDGNGARDGDGDGCAALIEAIRWTTVAGEVNMQRNMEGRGRFSFLGRGRQIGCR